MRLEVINLLFQVQDISVSVSSDWHANEIELMLDYSKMSTLDVANFRDDQEWTLFRHVELERIPEETNKDIELGYTAGFVIARCRVARRAKYGYFLTFATLIGHKFFQIVENIYLKVFDSEVDYFDLLIFPAFP